MTSHDVFLISPQLALVGVALFVIILDLFFQNKKIVLGAAFLGLAAPLAFSLVMWFDVPEDNSGLFGALVVDRFALYFHFLFIGVAALVFLSAARYQERFEGLKGEFAALMLLSVTGMMTLASTRELISMYVALELTSLPAAALVAFLRDDESTEAALKFLLMSAVSSAILLLGVVYIYGFTGSTFFVEIAVRINELNTNELLDTDIPFGSFALMTGIVMVMVGLAFKLALFPSQMWVPDVYQGAPTPVAAFLSVASKAAGFAIVLRLLYTIIPIESISLDTGNLFAALAAVSMTVGNVAAIRQKNIKRLMGYSTVAQAGYIAVGVAAVATATGDVNTMAIHGVMFYLLGYGFTNLAVFFAIIAITSKTGSDAVSSFAGMGKRSPLFAALLTLGLLSLLGMPPTVGFMAKAFVFLAAINSGLIWLAVLGMVNSAISAYYYLRVVRTMYLDEPESDEPIDGGLSVTFVTGITAAGIAVFGIAPWFLLRFAEVAMNGIARG
jgi:NADH-quinone oxidoreductase subunit N